jgi:hypothetical protein
MVFIKRQFHLLLSILFCHGWLQRNIGGVWSLLEQPMYEENLDRRWRHLRLSNCHWNIYETSGTMIRVIVFNTTFNNISVISWQPVLLVEETGKTTDLSQVTDKLYQIIKLMLYRVPPVWTGFKLLCASGDRHCQIA